MNTKLKSEAPWAIDVAKILEEKRSQTEDPLLKERIYRTIPDKFKREAERAQGLDSSGGEG